MEQEYEVHYTLKFRVRAPDRRQAFMEIDRLFEYQWRPQYEDNVRALSPVEESLRDPTKIVLDLDFLPKKENH